MTRSPGRWHTRENDMTDDQRMAAVLTECLADLDLSSADGTAGIKSMLRQIEEAASGSLEQMASRIQLARLPRGPRPH